MWVNVTAAFDQQRPLGHKDHKLHISLPAHLFTPHTENEVYYQKQTSSIILSYYLTNITVSYGNDIPNRLQRH